MNPLLETSAFDSDADQPMTLCCLPHKDRQVRFAIPSIYVELVELMDGSRSVDEAIEAFNHMYPGRFEKDWLRKLVESSLIPRGILIFERQDPASAAVSKQSKMAFLYIKLPIIKPGLVDPIARRLGFLYQRSAVIAGLILFIATHAYVYGVLLPSNPVDFNTVDASGILLLMLFSTLGTIFHEFGHASAAAYYGCRNMTIGWGLYIVYTVLWTDVSEAWKLPRKQRAMVDIGGVYFESIFLLIMLGAFLYTGHMIFLFAFIFIDLSIATTFNPFLRMDGYWLMSDLFGIVNLRQQQSIWLEGLVARLFGADESSALPATQLSKKARIALAIYSVLGALFFLFILKIVYEVMVLKVLFAFPDFLENTWAEVQSGMTIFGYAGATLEVAWRGMMIFGAVFMIYSLVKKIIGWLRRLQEIRTKANLQMELNNG